MNIPAEEVTFIANICPNCNLQGSFVSWVLPLSVVVSFTSKFVNLPQCISTDDGTILNVQGLGTIIFHSLIVQGTFGLNLLETPVGDDALAFSFSGFDQNGNPFPATITLTGVPDDEIMVNFCNSCSCPQSASMAANANSTSNNTREELKGKIVITQNGQVEVKELQ